MTNNSYSCMSELKHIPAPKGSDYLHDFKIYIFSRLFLLNCILF